MTTTWRHCPHSLVGVLALTLVLSLALPSLAAAQGEPSPSAPATSPAVTVEAISVTPEDPAVDTLVRLSVRVANHSTTAVTAFHFRVTVGGVDLPVYDQQNFLVNVEPGAEREVDLYNFWTTETGRPAPADGRLTVEVALDEAYPVELSTDEDGTEVWTLGEVLGGLDSSQRIVLELVAPKS